MLFAERVDQCAQFHLKSDLRRLKRFQHFQVFHMCNQFKVKYVPYQTNMSDCIKSFNAQLAEILIRKICMNVMRIFADKDELWLILGRQISAAQVLQALLLTRESNQTRIVKCIRPHILFSLAIMRRSAANLSAPECECWSLPATSKQQRVQPGDTVGSGQSPPQSTSSDP